MPQTYNSPKEVTVALPFSVDSYGNIATASTPEKIWAARVYSTLTTALGERVFLPSFGTRLAEYVLDTTSVASEGISSEIRNAFNSFLSDLEILTLDSYLNESDKVFYVELTYKLPNQNEASTIVGVTTLTANGLAIEELR